MLTLMYVFVYRSQWKYQTQLKADSNPRVDEGDADAGTEED